MAAGRRTKPAPGLIRRPSPLWSSREQAQLEPVDQVEPHERPLEADAAPDHDVAVAAQPELVSVPSSASKPSSE